MLKILCLLAGFSLLVFSKTFDYKVITTVRNGIERSLDYIDKHYQKVNVDCLFGIVLTAAIIKDAYQDGYHIMDNSSLKIIEKSFSILGKSLPIIPVEQLWLSHAILDYTIWEKSIKWVGLQQFSEILNFQFMETMINDVGIIYNYPNTDLCFQDIINITSPTVQRKCFINIYCSKMFQNDDNSAGYILTHKLLLLQFAKARKCIIDQEDYEQKTRQLCSQIFAEVLSGDYYDILDEMFDLFLEEIVVCGYEGYIPFFKNKWLYYILKTQKPSGCFAPKLDDTLKTRIKRNTNIFEDGCADHTTGLGAAVLALHYNFIIKENL